MENVYRQSAVRCDKARIDATGILRAKARIARVGIQNYFDNGKIVRELRRPSQVLDSADSFALKPILLNHPASEELVTSNDADTFKGTTGENVAYEDGWLVTKIAVTHNDAVIAAQTTHKYFSAGYNARLLDKGGVWIDEMGVMGKVGASYTYDKEQIDIVGNHVALVDNPRAGKNATFMDSEDSEHPFELEDLTINQKNHNTDKTKNKDIPKKLMVQIIHNDAVLTIEGEGAKEVKDIVIDLKAKLDSNEVASTATITDLNAKLDAANAEKDALTADKSTLEAKVDSLELKVTEADKRMDANEIATEVAARSNLWAVVLPRMDADYTPDYTLDCDAIKRAYLRVNVPALSEKIDSADASYLTALWDMNQPTEEHKENKTDSGKEFLSKGAGRSPESKTDAIETAQAAYIAARTRK